MMLRRQHGPAEGLQHAQHGGNKHPKTYVLIQAGHGDDTGRLWLNEMLDEEVVRKHQHFVRHGGGTGSGTSASPQSQQRGECAFW